MGEVHSGLFQRRLILASSRFPVMYTVSMQAPGPRFGTYLEVCLTLQQLNLNKGAYMWVGMHSRKTKLGTLNRRAKPFKIVFANS